MNFKLVSEYKPSGDQPVAIDTLTNGLLSGMQYQTLIGATGTGKTFTMANIIKNVNRPTLVISHNKTLAAQLFSEFKKFFPHNAVEYFVSYYDYYQPEAYVPSRDLYIEKDADINDTIERYRVSANQSLLTRRDVIVVATVSCIYGLGNPADYLELSVKFSVGKSYKRDKILARLTDMQYVRDRSDFSPGSFRVRGEIIDIYLTTSKDEAVRLEFFGEELEDIKIINPITGEFQRNIDEIQIFPAKQYVSPQHKLKKTLENIRKDLKKEVNEFKKKGKKIEAARLKQRVEFDLEMIEETGFVKGIENYSRYIDGRLPGSPPSCLLDYFPSDYVMFIDESHITVPQIGGMYNGDRARKQNLVNFGFRMKSALDNRPLKFDEFTDKINQVIFTTATPRNYEIEASINAAMEVKKQNPDLFNGKALIY
jgi:excinuclease ABC subunit B